LRKEEHLDMAEHVSDRSQWGQTSGSGMSRVCVTKPGDTLEDMAAYFYGDPVHRQRLIDDNPELGTFGAGAQIPGGSRIKVCEDASRGDAISGPAASETPTE
jgi:hypothetical protein